MLQRIQTLYLLISIICLSVIQFGGDIFYLIGEKMYVLNAYGIIDKMPGAEVKMVKNIPIFLAIVLLVVLLVVSIFSFKNLKKQLKLVKLTGVIYLLLILTLGFIALTNRELIDQKTPLDYKLSTGFYFLVMGFPGVLLAIQGIKKDLNLLDSLNRLR